VHHGANPRAYFVTRYGANHVGVWGLSGQLTSAQQLLVTQVDVGTFTTPADAPQKGTTIKVMLTNLRNYPLHAAYRAGKLYVVYNDAVNWYGDLTLTSNRFTRFNVAGYPAVTTEVDRAFGGNSAFYDAPTTRVHYAFPAVEVNRNGDAVVAYNRYSGTFYPQASFSVYRAAESDVEPSRLLASGVDFVQAGTANPVQLNDLNGISVDPFDDTAVWMVAPVTTLRSLHPWGNFVLQVGKVFGSKVADLTIGAAVSFTPASVPSIGTYKVATTIRNQGDGPTAATKVNVYLTRVGTRTSIQVGTIDVPALPAGQAAAVSKVFVRSSGLAAGDYTVKLIADGLGQYAEYDEANNAATRVGTIHLK
jgi:hypothetical protein